MLNKIWPTNGAPVKEEVERMYKCAYYIDRNFLKSTDVVDFGIDVYRLKECGEVRMKKTLQQIRPHVQPLWERMNRAQKVMFFYSYLCQSVGYVRAILQEMEALVGDVGREKGFLDGIPDSVYLKFPKELKDKIKDGFGSDWSG